MCIKFIKEHVIGSSPTISYEFPKVTSFLGSLSENDVVEVFKFSILHYLVVEFWKIKVVARCAFEWNKVDIIFFVNEVIIHF